MNTFPKDPAPVPGIGEYWKLKEPDLLLATAVSNHLNRQSRLCVQAHPDGHIFTVPVFIYEACNELILMYSTMWSDTIYTQDHPPDLPGVDPVLPSFLLEVSIITVGCAPMQRSDIGNSLRQGSLCLESAWSDLGQPRLCTSLLWLMHLHWALPGESSCSWDTCTIVVFRIPFFRTRTFSVETRFTQAALCILGNQLMMDLEIPLSFLFISERHFPSHH